MKYEPQTLSDKDKMILKTLAKNSMINIQRVEQDLTTMLEAIKVYKMALEDDIDLETEEADLIHKYAAAPTMGVYNLPAVMVGTRANYDLGTIKEDNTRLEQIKDLAKEAKGQAEAYQKIIVSNFGDLSAGIKKMNMFALNIRQSLTLING
jgi:hypothetical protein